MSYTSRQINSVEKNYTTTEWEGLSMIFVVKKFRHYLLANKFIFFTDHQALLYLINKPCDTRRIVRWFLILLEFNFRMVVKQGKTHLRADHLSGLANRESRNGTNDEFPNEYLFNIEMIPRWSQNIVTLLSVGAIHEQPIRTIKQSCLYTLLAGRLYKARSNHILNLHRAKREGCSS